MMAATQLIFQLPRAKAQVRRENARAITTGQASVSPAPEKHTAREQSETEQSSSQQYINRDEGAEQCRGQINSGRHQWDDALDLHIRTRTDFSGT
jgi:hypothetical protein